MSNFTCSVCKKTFEQASTSPVTTAGWYPDGLASWPSKRGPKFTPYCPECKGTAQVCQEFTDTHAPEFCAEPLARQWVLVTQAVYVRGEKKGHWQAKLNDSKQVVVPLKEFQEALVAPRSFFWNLLWYKARRELGAYEMDGDLSGNCGRVWLRLRGVGSRATRWHSHVRPTDTARQSQARAANWVRAWGERYLRRCAACGITASVWY